MSTDLAAKFAQLLAQSQQGDSDDDNDVNSDTPGYTSDLPHQFLGKSIRMSRMEISKSRIPTLIFAIVTSRFNEASFKHDKGRILKLLGLQENDPSIHDMKLYSEAGNKDRMDTEACVAKIIAMANSDAFRNGPFEKIRIIGMGCAGNNFLYQAMTQVLQKYATPNTKLHFITLDDTDKSDWLSFCKSIVATELVEEVEFLNTDDFTPFGRYKPKKEVNMF